MEKRDQLLEVPVAQSGSTGISAKQVSILRHVIGYVGGGVLTLLALRTLLALLSASAGNAFADIVFTLSNVFTWPFSLLFTQVTHGQWTIEVAAIAGIVMYSTLIWAGIRLTRLIPVR